MLTFSQLAIGERFRFSGIFGRNGHMEKNSNTTYLDAEGKQWKCGHLAPVERV